MRKGQMFSLDLLVSVAAVTLALGLMVQTVELNTYNQKESRQFNEVKMVAERAGYMLVSHPDIVCVLVEDNESQGVGNPDVFGNLQNCLSKVDSKTGIPGGFWDYANNMPVMSKINGRWWENQGNNRDAKFLDRRKLGITDDFKCRIDMEGGGLAGDEVLIVRDCWDDDSDVENYYSVQRQVVVYSEENDSAVWKSHLDECIEGSPNCKLIPATVTIKAWKV